MRALKLSTAGVRGVVGETLTPQLLVNFAQAFGTYVESGPVLISRDTRNSGNMVTPTVIAGLMGCGCEVTDLGICPTAALQLAVKTSDAAGGIAVTAGHNDASWNALKFIRADGIFLNPRQSEELLDIYHQGEYTKAEWDELKPLKSDPQVAARHWEAVLAQVDQEKIAAACLKVAVDCANGACSQYSPRLLESLGCRVVAINTETDLPFPHPPEPSHVNLSQLRALVQAAEADVGFAHDADGDRLGVVCANGDAPGEQMTMCLCTEMILCRGDPGPVVTNLSTTMAVRDIARRHGRQVHFAPIGQAYITESALNYDAAIAGEGSGGIVFPRLNYAHDSMAAMAHILDLLAGAEQTLEQFIDENMPRYVMHKEQVPCPTEQAYSVLEGIRAQDLPDWAESEDLRDGVKIMAPDRWVHIRVSQTEPLIRVIAEAADEQTAAALTREYVSRVRRLL